MPIRGRSSRLIISLVILFVIALGGIVGLRTWYFHNLSAVSSSNQIIYFIVESGSGSHVIAENLKTAGLIRSISAFETYVTTNNLRGKLQAGTYELRPSMGVKTIVYKMANGDISKNLLTILPGKRIDQIKSVFRKAGYSKKEVETAFNPELYIDHPALASLPQGASLEGYLYPDSFQKDSNTNAQVIIRQSLDEMNKYLTSDLLAGFKRQNLTPAQAVTLASIILKETDNKKDMPVVAQVLLTRIKLGMLLQADATAYYVTDKAGLPHNLSIDSPYNTYKHQGLPPGPISNVTKEALNAAAKPAKTDFLFYVTGDDSKTRFSRTQAEHEAAVRQYCHVRCQQ